MVTVFYNTNQNGDNVVRLIHHNPDSLASDARSNFDGEAQVDEANIPYGSGTLVYDENADSFNRI